MIRENSQLLTQAFFALLMLGFLLRRAGVFKDHDTRVFSRLVTDVTLPALVLSALHSADFDPALLTVVGMGWLLMGLSLGLSFVLGRVLNLPPEQRHVLMVSGSIGNTGFLGVPLIYSLMEGSNAVAAPAVTFDMAVTTLAMYTLGIMIFQKGQPAGETVGSPMRRVFKMPVFWAAGLGYFFMLTRIPLPEVAVYSLQKLGAITVPLVLITIGILLRARSIKSKWKPAVLVTGFKCLLVPAMAYGLLQFTSLSADIERVILLLSAMPCAMVSAILAAQYDSDGELAATSVTLSTFVSMLLLPLWLKAGL